MKHTKKMIMVPETEYLALLNMLKGGDYLQTEKAVINTEIQKNLNDASIPADLKATKHDFLVKQRRQLQGIIEHKPQKVIFENPTEIPSIAPYLGITRPPTSHFKNEIDERSKPIKVLKTPRRKKAKRVPTIEESSTAETNGRTSDSEEIGTEETESEGSTSFETPNEESYSERIHGTPLFHPNIKKQLINYIESNKDELKITAKGKVFDYRNNTIKNSDYNKIIDYLTGKTKETPIGTKFLKERLMKDSFIRQMANQSSPMSGRGKRVLVKLKVIKTPGLVRQEKKTKFKPTIWAKI